MSQVSEAAAQLTALADNLPFGAAQHLSSELETIASQASSIVADTGHADLVQTINHTGAEIAEQMTTQLGALAQQIREKAEALQR